jgi:hypothetical protein
VNQRACTHPSVGFPTCYSLQADGTWAREELTDLDANWVVVGTVTADEVAAAIGDGNDTAVHVASLGPAVAVQGTDVRFLEINTITLPSVSDAVVADAAPAMTSSQRWFLEVNTTMLPQGFAQAYMEDLTPSVPGTPR